MTRPSWIVAITLAVLAGLAGIAYGTLNGWTRSAYIDLRRETRLTLGMEKNWTRLPGPSAAAGRTPVACPDPAITHLLVTGGQSNAANAGTARATLPEGAEVYIWFDGQCFHGEDPMLGAGGTGGSLWPPIGAALADGLGAPVLFVNGAVGASQVGDWLDRRSGYLNTLLGRIAQAQTAGYTPELILWHQGETDAGIMPDTPKGRATMQAQFEALTGALLEATPNARLYLFQASKCTGAQRVNGVAAMRAVQRAVADGNDRIIEGLDTDTFGDDFRWDRCHFNSHGREAITDVLAPQLLATLQDRPAE